MPGIQVLPPAVEAASLILNELVEVGEGIKREHALDGLELATVFVFDGGHEGLANFGAAEGIEIGMDIPIGFLGNLGGLNRASLEGEERHPKGGKGK